MATFADKLDRMRADLASIAHRMNVDGNEGIATRAQDALNAVAALQNSNDGWFIDLEWTWKPSKE